MHSDAEPRRARGQDMLLTAAGSSLVLYDGSRLLHCADPLDPDPSWEELADLNGQRLVALTSCADLNPQHTQLFAATTTSQLLSWTWRGQGAEGDGDSGWHAWQPESLEASPIAVAGWSLGAGQQEMVIADSDSTLWTRHRSDWEAWSEWEFIGVILDLVGLDVRPSSTGTVELYAVTDDGELKRKVRDSSSTTASSWSSAEIAGDWPDQALAVATWSLPEEAEDQAILLSSGELRQRWRRAGTVEWSPWWSAPPAPMLGSALTVTGWSCPDGRQTIAVLGSAGDLTLRLWSPQGGWLPWLPPVRLAAQLPTTALPSASPSSPADAGLPADGPTNVDSPASTGVSADSPELDPTGLLGTRAEETESTRAEEATVLFAGRQLLPLLSNDPVQIGPFKLQKRIAGGQASTDKFVARDGRGYCFLKVLKPEATDDERVAFGRESEMARRVVDRHRLANFIDARPGDDTQPAYLALSFEQGKHLGELCGARPLPPAELQLLARSLLEALSELRACEILHLDIKPSNVIMRNGDYPVVVDYGSAVPADTTELLEAAFGTKGYAAPEFVERRAVNQRTDTYSWGAVLVAAATGEPPSSDPRQRAEQIARLPGQLPDLVSTALAEDPVNRLTLEEAIKRMSPTQPLASLGIGIRDRLSTDALHPIVAPEPPALSPARLVAWLEQLAPWRYRAGAGAAAVTGIVLGLIVGVLFLQLLRSI